MPRVFLDANVLFSAAWRSDAGLARLWKLRGVTLVTSGYAVAEARVNLDTDEQRRRLDKLVASIEVLLESTDDYDLPEDVDLPQKDQPILAAAIHGRCKFLLTGDVRHFGKLYRQVVEGVTIMRPAQFFESRQN